MLFHSTRGKDSNKDFASILMQGLADDGGLFMPDHWPQVDLDEIKSKTSFVDIAKCIVPLFTASSFSRDETIRILESTWHDFEHQDLIGIKNFHSVSILELFHGPTAAFKDFGLQLAAAFFNKVLESENKTAIVLGATSGDTGSAAIDACKNYGRIKSFIMLPNGNMSEVQRRQMSTIKASNVFALRINGTFDDCQDLVKHAFKKRDFLNNNQYLLAVNSINWTRIVGQICYYFYAYNQLHQKTNLNFSIPTGNFGNVFACYSAHKMGMPLNKILVAVNDNNILHRFFSNNDYSKQKVSETVSPSMDISIASNFERLVYDFYTNRNAESCMKFYSDFPEIPIKIEDSMWNKSKDLFLSYCVDDFSTVDAMKDSYTDFNYLMDPHTAVASKAVEQLKDKLEGKTVILSTAHPAKFPDVIHNAGLKINDTPNSLSVIFDKKEKIYNFPASKDAIFEFITSHNK